jgi:hypothetical protein
MVTSEKTPLTATNLSIPRTDEQRAQWLAMVDRAESAFVANHRDRPEDEVAEVMTMIGFAEVRAMAHVYEGPDRSRQMHYRRGRRSVAI